MSDISSAVFQKVPAEYQSFWNEFPPPRQYEYELARSTIQRRQVSVELAIEITNSLLLSDDADPGLPPIGQVQDQHLLAAFAQGDREAFTTLYKRHSRAVFHFAFYMAGDSDRADDLTQEVFVWLIHNPAAFDPERGSLPAFLGGVARKFLRRQQRSESRWSPLEDAIDTLYAMASHTPSLATDAAINASQLRQAIALLPVRYREVVVLCDLQEKQYAEAALILGCSVGTVRSRLHRGRNLLARKLNPDPATITNRKGGRHAL